MIAAPWYLLSIGIFVLLVGFFLAAIRRPPGGDQRVIDPNMSDDEIVENLQDRGWGRSRISSCDSCRRPDDFGEHHLAAPSAAILTPAVGVWLATSG